MKNAFLIDYVNGRSCAVLGLGVSNMPLVRLLLDAGAEVTVYDKHSAEELGERALELFVRGARFIKDDGNFDNIDGQLIFRSPGIRPDKRGILNAIERGAELTSEIELLLKLTRAKTYAITGSDGKTTTTTLTGKFLSEAASKGNGEVYVGGNIGTPLLDKCDHMQPGDFTVLELSSFQLMTLGDAPERVAITNISPNHLDWHKDMGEYVRAKENIIGVRTKRLVTNADCAETLRIARDNLEGGNMEIVLFSSVKHSFDEIFAGIERRENCFAVYTKDSGIYIADAESESLALSLEDIKIPGRHNVENYMTAIGLTFGDVLTHVYKTVANGFLGVEHRLEFVRRVNGVDYYNSSIDSSPTRTAAALSALADRSIVLICGGYDKKIPYEPLAMAICEHGGIRAVSLTGATGEKIRCEIEKYCRESGKGREIILEYSTDFYDAVSLAKEMAREGDALLLSPASASFDYFKNFMERGNVFKDIVNNFK